MFFAGSLLQMFSNGCFFQLSIVFSERPIVRVEATVMIRGEIGFTPHLGYGNSKIAIYESLSRNEYLLHGYKIQDQKVSAISLCLLRRKTIKFSLCSRS